MNNKSTIKVIIYDNENKPKEIYIDMNDYSWMYQPYRANVASRSSENTFV